ncbi:phosphatidate cytidylyltransferase [Hymenobacter metallicola]|uniref:Phosphatidate cytidylyltransferase n=1 Tax=Hymenobacter metallicola TaxID=2563114 RepID=A0A4Z0QBU1_9BACT|nr:phosphatidate cytidylyltransferase [Hymenobacter metallicola]TGE26531.1 phosphatidate cytidylyltransferase [Hymenobacter metallicola]
MSESSPLPTATNDPPADGRKPMSNLAQRVIFGVIGAVLLLGSVWFSAWTFALFFALVQAKMLHEFYRMMREAGYKPAAILGICISLLIFFTVFIENQFAQYDGGPENRIVQAAELTLIGLALLLSVLLLLREMSAWPRENQSVVPFANVGVNLLGLFYVSLPMSLLSAVAFADAAGQASYDYRRIFALLFLVWCSDIGAYAAGKTFGKHKLAPTISPGKTWEGAIGGFLLTLLMGWALGFWLTDLSLAYRLVAAGTVAVFGPLGDLAESMLKRSVDIKDSGTIMPGHGGLLDRFDAFLFILPVLALLQLLFA